MRELPPNIPEDDAGPLPQSDQPQSPDAAGSVSGLEHLPETAAHYHRNRRLGGAKRRIIGAKPICRALLILIKMPLSGLCKPASASHLRCIRCSDGCRSRVASGRVVLRCAATSKPLRFPPARHRNLDYLPAFSSYGRFVMSTFMCVLCGWLALNLAIAAAMYFKPLRARRPLKFSARYGSLAFAGHRRSRLRHAFFG